MSSVERARLYARWAEIDEELAALRSLRVVRDDDPAALEQRLLEEVDEIVHCLQLIDLKQNNPHSGGS